MKRFAPTFFMPLFTTLLVGLLALEFSPRTLAQGTVTLTANTNIDATNAATYQNKNLVIQNCTVTLDHSVAFPTLNLLSLTIQVNGVLTQVAGNDGGVNVNATGNLTLITNGRIVVDGKGYAPSTGPGAGGNGRSGTTYGRGGGHGSYGGLYGAVGNGDPYDSMTVPVQLGSGGGSFFDGATTTYPGTSGGGAIKLIVGGKFSADTGSVVSAYGTNYSNAYVGTGSGGAIWISCDSFESKAAVVADGGNSWAGSGSGGRIAVYYNSFVIDPVTVSYARPGTSANGVGYAGGAGTVYLKKISDTKGDLLLDGNFANTNVPQRTLIPANLGLKNLTLKNGAYAYFDDEATLASLTMDTFSLLSPLSGELLSNKTLKLTVTGDVLIKNSAALYATGYGYPQLKGPGAGLVGNATGDKRGGGGGHAGEGGDGYNNGGSRGGTYDPLDQPIEAGSGGGNYGVAQTYIGGTGGGVINLTVGGTLTLDANGYIAANGAGGQSYCGGGAGGSIWITTKNFAGNTSISANGGTAGDNYWGNGGGGRIALYYDSSTYTGALNAASYAYGNSYSSGGAGTIYIKPSTATLPNLILDNARGDLTTDAKTPLTDIFVFDSVTVRNGARMLTGGFSANSLLCEVFGTLSPPIGTPLALSVTNDATFRTSGNIDASGRGYLAGTGPGKGTNGDAQLGRYGGGGAHAGFGGYASGGVYGSITQPMMFGSGGGLYNRPAGQGISYGGNGGGTVTLTVGGTLTVNAGLYVDGYGGDGNYAGGGAGGSLLITAKTLTGIGALSSVGGGGYCSGSGGRIALNYETNTFTGSLRAYSSAVTWCGGVGTIYLKQKSDLQADLLLDNSHQNYNTALTPLPTTLPIRTLTARNDARLSLDAPYTVSTFTLDNYSIVYPVGSSINLTVTGDSAIRNNSGFETSGYGYAGGQGPGAGVSGSTAKGYRASGAGHGGFGAYNYGTTQPGGIPYDLYTQPTEPGSGGGNFDSNIGSAGGGVIRYIVSGTLLVDGSSYLRANGTWNDSDTLGAGSGGSIWLTAGSLNGGGSITATGGRAYYANGAGGRIAFYSTSGTYSGSFNATGGVYNGGYYRGAAGTIYTQLAGATKGDLYINNATSEQQNNLTPLTLVAPLHNLTLTSGVSATFSDNKVTADNILLDYYVTIYPSGSGSKNAATVSMTALGNLTLARSSRILTNGYGYAATQGTNAGGSTDGTTYTKSAGGGGGGGAGGDGKGSLGSGGIASGIMETPIEIGGGGGNFGSAIGGAGGGAIRLIVNGTLSIGSDCNLYAQGNDRVGDYAGGGGGGSIWITAGQFTGAGGLYATGGRSYAYSGGGGGGRIAIYAVDFSGFTGLHSVTGGNNQYTGTDDPNYGRWGKDGTYYTQQISAVYALTSLTLSANGIGSGQALSGTVTLSGVAPSGGLTVSLLSSNTAVITVADSVVIPEGASSVNFPLTVSSVSAPRQVTISATAAGINKAAEITVSPWLSALQFTPTSVSGGDVTVGTVKLATPAPSSGLILTLTSSDPTVTFPDGNTVTVPSGAVLSPSFRVQTPAVTTAKVVTIGVTYAGERRSLSLYISPTGPKLRILSISPSVVLGGRVAVGIVTLDRPAPAGGVFVSLATNVSSILLPSPYIRVPVGRTSASFNIATQQVGTTVNGQVTATLGTSLTRPLTVRGVGIVAFDLIPSSVTGGDTSIGVVTLEQASSVPVIITIASNRGEAVPEVTTLTIPAGETTGTFVVNTTSVTSLVTPTLTVVANGTQKSRKLTINP